jgi:D-3-phosphoglycerate dehydrogenase
MITIQLLDNISHKALSLFDANRYQSGTEINNPDVILVRSHKMHDFVFLDNLKAVARAGAGTDNIPVDKLTQLGIPVFYAPGANANAVKELVLAAMLIGYRNLDKARTFLSDLAQEVKQSLHQEIEIHKKKFVGHEISGKTLGVIGLGNIGVKVANSALGLGMRVLAYDPDMTIPNALALMPTAEKVSDMNEVLSRADIISLHVPLNNMTTNLINESNINLFRSDALLLNFSREQVVNESVILQHLTHQKMRGYITDFPTNNLASHPHVICFPHLGASTMEAELNCAEMVIKNVCNYLEHGIIEHSVNFPDISLSTVKTPNCHRVMIVNKNVPGAIGKITQKLSQLGYNIEKMVNNSRGNVAVNLIDISGPTNLPERIGAEFKEIESVIQLHVVAEK